jgi:hypothetical protein
MRSKKKKSRERRHSVVYMEDGRAIAGPDKLNQVHNHEKSPLSMGRSDLELTADAVSAV